MEIIIQTTLGFVSMSNTKLATKVIKFTDTHGNTLGYLSGDQLNEQLQTGGFEIKEIKI